MTTNSSGNQWANLDSDWPERHQRQQQRRQVQRGQEQERKEERKLRRSLPFSGMGIGSLAIGLVSAMFLALGVFVFVSIQAKLTSNERLIQQAYGHYQGGKFFDMAFMQALILTPIGGVLGACGYFCQSERRHSATVAGFILNGLVLAMALLACLIG